MNLEKLGLLFLINYFNQLSHVKKHLQTAAKEVLLAMDASLEIVSQVKTKPDSRMPLGLLSPFINQARGVVRFAIGQVNPSLTPVGPADTGLIKDHIVSSLISAIDEEIESCDSIHLEPVRLKVEALQTVRRVLMNQTTSKVGKLVHVA